MDQGTWSKRLVRVGAFVKRGGKGRAVSAARQVPEPDSGGQQARSVGGGALQSVDGTGRAVLLRRARHAARLRVAVEGLARELAAARHEIAVLRRENAALRDRRLT